MSLRLKASQQAIRGALARHRRAEVYHWTPAELLPSVLERGLLCRDQLAAQGIAFHPHSYGRAGKAEDFAGHVCVSFFPQKGMMRSESGPPALIVLPSTVIAAEGAFYCPENTARNEDDFDELKSRTEVEHLEELFEGPDEWRLIDWQAEVWIPEGIPTEEFRAVYFRNEGDRDDAVGACAAASAALARPIPFGVGKGWHFPEPPAADELEGIEF